MKNVGVVAVVGVKNGGMPAGDIKCAGCTNAEYDGVGFYDKGGNIDVGVGTYTGRAKEGGNIGR